MNYKKMLMLTGVTIIPMFFGDFTYKKVAGSHPGSTGAPGDNTCAKTGCHAGTVISNDNIANSFIFPTLDSTYTPGQTYLVKLKITDGIIQRFGFEIVALKDATNNNVGVWTITQPTATQIISHAVGSDTRLSVTHKQAGTMATPLGVKEWEFNWTAPSTNEGNITFYYATNATNNNGNFSGDKIRTTNFKIKPLSSVGIEKVISEKELIAFYNANGNYFDVQYLLTQDEIVTIRILDISGKEIYFTDSQMKRQGLIAEKINVQKDLSHGIYFVNVIIGEKKFSKKIFIN